MSSSSSEALSANDSDAEAETGLHASASAAARPSLATQLREISLRRQIDSTQFRANDPSDFHDRLAALQYQNEHQDHGQDQSSSSSTGSDSLPTSSMAVSVISQSTLRSSLSSSSGYPSTRVPSLSGTCTTLRSIQSAKTASTTAALGRHYELERDEEDFGLLPEEEYEDGKWLQCSFSFLACSCVFADIRTWDVHCRAHYRGRLPSIAECPFPNCAWREEHQVGQDVWIQRLKHMLEEHEREGFAYTRRRPETAVLDHLRQHDLIDSMQYQELRRDGRLSESAIPNHASRRDEQRRRRR